MPATATDRLYGITTSVAVKPPCRVATTANITLSGLQTVDGVVLVADDRVLVKNQTSSVNNGIYVANTSAWERAKDFDGTRDAVSGTLVIVRSGSTNNDTCWELTTTDPVVIGTSALTFEKALLQDSATAAFTQAGTGAGVRTSQDKMRDTLATNDFTGASDTVKLQNALTEAGSDGNGQRRVVFDAGAYTIADVSVSYGSLRIFSETLVDGAGAKLTATGTQNYYMLCAYAATQVTVRNMHLVATATSGTNDGKAGLIFSQNGLGSDAKNITAYCNYLLGTSWGVLTSAESGTEKIYGVCYHSSMVESAALGQNDAFHAAGRVYGVRYSGLYARNRGDAAFAVTMSSTYNGGGATLMGGVAEDCQVGIDFAGTRRAVEVGNMLHNTVANATSNPALRIITNDGAAPEDIVCGSGIALSNGATSSEYDIKVDTTAGSNVHAYIHGKLTQSAYIARADYVTYAINVHKAGGVLRIDSDAREIHIGNNFWEDDMNIYVPANVATYGPVFLDRQSWNKGTDSNFLSSYGGFHTSAVKLLGSEPVYQLGAVFSTSSAAYTDVTGAVFYIPEPCLIAGLDGVADLATHPAYIAVTDMSNNVVAAWRFATSPGVPATNVATTPESPTTSGNTSYARIAAAGVYKLRIKSDLNQVDLKAARVRIWN